MKPGFECLMHAVLIPLGIAVYYLQGHGSASEMKGTRNPHVASHGSFSIMVDPTSILEFFTTYIPLNL